MLTNKGKYGLKAMVHLAGLERGRPALVADIAATNAIPKKFLDAILGELRTAGLVHSKKGRGGGYVLAKSPPDIMVGEIVRALDGPLAQALYSAALFTATEGRAYSVKEYRKMLESAHLRAAGRVVPTAVHCGILTGTKG